jgi:protein-L-isoaspartate(D-aspartate) O-methyltransferase
MVSSDIRERYVEEIQRNAKISSSALLRAFAEVPREEFVGQGPWQVLSRPPGHTEAQVGEVTNPAELYRDVAVFLDASRSLTNGNPGTLAAWLDALNLAAGNSVFHLGCGTGYYTAIIAEMVGENGQIIAVEIDPSLAAQARRNLGRYGNVEVIRADGGVLETGERSAILINAGVTHPRESWLDNLQIGGNLVLPLTFEFGMPHVGKGMVLHVSRLESGYAAHFFPTPVVIYSCSSVRDPWLSSLLAKAFRSGNLNTVRSVRRDSHSIESSCWLHAPGFCLSTGQPGTP